MGCHQPQGHNWLGIWERIFVTLFGKTRLNENSVAFFRCNAFQCIENALKSISIAFWNVGIVFQWNWNALQIHFKIISKHCQCVFKHWQHIQWNGWPFGIIHRTAAISYQNLYNELLTTRSSTYSITNLSVWIWAEISNTLSFPM